MNIKIRQERPSDQLQVFTLNRSAFGRDNEAKLVDSLRKSEAFIPGLSLVAIVTGKLVGHILFTKVTIRNNENKSFNSLSLAPMSVDKAYQNQGIGGRLINAGLKKAQDLGYRSVIVLGHAEYYPKFGFKPAGKWQIMPPFDVPDDVFMAIELVRNGLKGVNGIVEYPKEFKSV